MISLEQAKKLILIQNNTPPATNPKEHWIISHAFASPCGDYWYINGNLRAYIENQNGAYCLVGNNGYLIHRHTAEIQPIPSHTPAHGYMLNQAEKNAAKGQYYVLTYTGDANKKRDRIKLHQVLECSYSEAKHLQNHPHWLAGEFSTYLNHAKELLSQHQITTHIELLPVLPNYSIRVELNDIWFWEQLKNTLHQNFKSKI